MSKLVWIWILLLCGLTSYSQITPEWYAQTRMEKGKWSKAEQSIEKALRKDSLNPEARYIYAQWFFAAANPRHSIDSSYNQILMALRDYSKASPKLKERLNRIPLDSNTLVRLREKIDSAAFVRAKEENTEKSYNTFLARFHYAKERNAATELRDEVSFLNALKINTYQSFDEYVNKYPQSHRAREARDRYERLLFEEKTKDGKLKSFVTFYHDYPSSPYRAQVEEKIFEISTASGETADFLKFISDYPNGIYTKRSADLIYHISRANEEPVPAKILNDSIKKMILLEKGFWVPFLKSGKFGFMNENGVEMLPAQFVSVHDDYLCGNITKDYLITSAGIVSRNGAVIYEGKLHNTDDVGHGFLFGKAGACGKIIHKSGWTMKDCFSEARIIADQFLALDKDGKWGLFAFNGKQLLEFRYDDIRSENNVVILTRNRKKFLNSIGEIVATADGNTLPEKRVFDEVRKLSSKLLLVKNGALEGVINERMEFEIKLDRQVLSLTSFGFVKRMTNKVTTVGVSEVIDHDEFNDIKPYASWLGLYKPADIKLYHLPASKMIATGLDSLWFTNRLALAQKNDSLNVYFASGKKMRFARGSNVSFIPCPDSVRYFYSEEKSKKQVFDVDSGNRLFTGEFETIEYIGYNTFLIGKDEKKGLLSIDGKILLPAEYDGMVKPQGKWISLLKEKKFGLYDLQTRTLVKPAFERNLMFFNDAVLIAFKDGYYGFVDRAAKPLSEFEFEDVRMWSDSSALVKRNFHWMVYNIYTKEINHGKIRDYFLLRDDATEKLALIHVENEYGILSSKKGLVIPPTFSDVLNIGTAEKPLYFTEKNVEEADIFVVIYYDENGKMIRRQVYEADEYDRIYCQN